MKVLIIGHARHGKDTVAEIMRDMFGLNFESSSMAAARIFLYDVLKDGFGYATPDECFEDRVNHRSLWHDLICDYNRDDKARLAKDILQSADCYVGMRSAVEVQSCMDQGVFDVVIGVYDPRKPHEPADSFNINIWEHSDIVILNNGTLEDLKRRVSLLRPLNNMQ